MPVRVIGHRIDGRGPGSFRGNKCRHENQIGDERQKGDEPCRLDSAEDVESGDEGRCREQQPDQRVGPAEDEVRQAVWRDGLVGGPNEDPNRRRDQADDAPDGEGDPQGFRAGNLSAAIYLFLPC